MAEIKFLKGDMLRSRAPILVNPVDAIGVMNDGISRKLKAAYPEMQRGYREQSRRGQTAPGRIWLHKARDGRTIANMSVRDMPGEPCRAEAVVKAVTKLRELVTCRGAESVAIPAFGGEGTMERETMTRAIQRLLDMPGLAVEIYEPGP